MQSLPVSPISVSGSALPPLRPGVWAPVSAAHRGERAPLGAAFCDLAVRPTSPAWRGEEDEGAEASSGDIGSLDYQGLVVDIEARLRMEGVELKEEWQDEDFPIPLPEDDSIDADILDITGPESQPDSLEVNGNKLRKKLMAPDISLTLDPSDGSVLSDDLDESGEIDLDGLDTPSENSNEFEWEDDLPKPKTTEVIRKDSMTEYTAAEEKEDGRRWRLFRIGEQDHRVDMKAIEPYKKVISHGGYYGDGLNAIVVFAVCFMPESSQPNYRYLMDNLFKYVIGTLELLVAENYMIVYLNGATTRRKMPSLGWLRKCYQQIDRRLRKNLKSLIIVHPSWFIRTLLAVTRPFISSKFSQKIRYVFNLAELAELVPMEYVGIPECIKQYEEEKLKKKQKRVDQELNGKQDEPKSEQ
ncbi:BCL2/adenovirus E1B 19 kDa protein-interacting protein 2 isoform X1 [Trichechus manatus latirostris]|uniref:BCL2/adenovirus E1B 19 kDa protein-interacting protein 2 isoform X1 n=1 Tax=Trichechus manatus latirostris TaxID=127582 RepID=A0A2Y9QPR9_TRIMA|nr:BCL2/adenovirus E1B 19 kDa protein-interacting protein 2 isoform X1 [Trichechus manatus latirostris]